MSNQPQAQLSSTKQTAFEQYLGIENKPSVFSRMGSKFGKVFVNAKSNVTNKYLEIVKGFNDSLEKERLIQEHLFQQELIQQATEYEECIHTLKNQYLTRLIIGIIMALAVGGIIGYLTPFFF